MKFQDIDMFRMETKETALGNTLDNQSFMSSNVY